MVLMDTNDPLRDTELTFLLGMAFQLVLGEFVSRLDKLGYDDLRPVHGLVFQALGRDGATSTELSERLGVTKQAAGQMVDHLVNLGYLERRPHPAGGRRRMVVLTEKAMRHLALAGQTLYQLESEIAKDIDDSQLADLRARLAVLIRSLAGNAIPPLRPVW
jgi:DNA-binding MarR family transcriptional regulator